MQQARAESQELRSRLEGAAADLAACRAACKQAEQQASLVRFHLDCSGFMSVCCDCRDTSAGRVWLACSALTPRPPPCQGALISSRYWNWKESSTGSWTACCLELLILLILLSLLCLTGRAAGWAHFTAAKASSKFTAEIGTRPRCAQAEQRAGRAEAAAADAHFAAAKARSDVQLTPHSSAALASQAAQLRDALEAAVARAEDANRRARYSSETPTS